MKKICTLFLLLIIGFQNNLPAQKWSMESCIKYAQEHNLTIRDNELNTRLAKLSLLQSKLLQLPSANVSGAYGRSYTSVVDPVVSTFTGLDYNFLNLTGNADVLLFGWFARRNLIAKGKYALQAANADYDQAKEDVSLNVATGYLRALLAKEQISVSEKQIELTAVQLDQARREVRAGTAAELGAVLLQSQLSVDSTNYLIAVSVYNSAMLDLKALLALSATSNFEIESPEGAMKGANVELSSPEIIYETALQKMGKMRSIDYNIQAAQKYYNATHALLYPRLSFVTQISTVYTNISKDYSVTGYNNVVVPATYIDVNGTQYPVYQNSPTYDVKQQSLGEQLNNNLSRVYALSLNVPLFNGWRTSYNAKTAAISLESEKNRKDEEQMNLKRDIYKAYDEVKIAAQKYNTARRAVELSQTAMFFSQKRMSTGLMTTLEYLQVQNSGYTLKAQQLAAKYDYILKLKIIDYYMGRDLTY